MMKSERLLGGLVLGLALCLATPVLAEDLASVEVSAAAVRWETQGANVEKTVLTVTLPNGNVIRREMKAGQPMVFELDGAAKDGVYTYELRGVPQIDASVRRELQAARRAGKDAEVMQQLRESGKLPKEMVQSGSFQVHEGTIIGPGLTEPRRGTAAATSGIGVITAADQVIADDLIVQGSTCVGLDCVANESFGFDTLRLKENNTRIKFDDTSASAGFPANDWQLTANDSASGGSSKFSIEDITGSKVPFTVTAGASTNSIFVDSTGRVGFRTATPVLDLHVATSNTPAIRLEQNNSGGFTAQTWDIGANEANFFVRDVTGGSRLSLRIRPGAPTSSIDISADGDVGMGTASPQANLHVASSTGSTTQPHLMVEDTNGTASARTMAQFANNGDVRVEWVNSALGATWGINMISDQMRMIRAGVGTPFTLSSNGNMTITGTLTQGSSREIKTNFVSLDPKDVLARVTALPVSIWSYKTDAGVRHLGPMAEDFHQAFGLGEDDKHIAPGDQAGVALLAVQGLNQVVQEKDKEIADLKSRLETLEKLVQNLSEKNAAASQQ
jgi:hypothetical protein